MLTWLWRWEIAAAILCLPMKVGPAALIPSPPAASPSPFAPPPPPPPPDLPGDEDDTFSSCCLSIDKNPALVPIQRST